MEERSNGRVKSEKQKTCIKDRKLIQSLRKGVFCLRRREGAGEREKVHAWARIQVGGTELIN